MALSSGKKIGWENWSLIPILDTLIARFNTLGGNQPKLLTFIDRHSCLNVFVETQGVSADSDKGEVEIPGVDAELDEEKL